MHIQLNWSMQINPRVAALIIVASFKTYLYVRIFWKYVYKDQR